MGTHLTKKARLIRFFAALGAIFASLSAQAQTDIIMSQHWALPTLYNPARAGQTDWLRVTGGARLQWVGIAHAPKSFVAAGDMPFQIGRKRIGAGLNIQQESIGLFSNLMVNAQGAYTFKLGPGRLAAAFQIGYVNSSFNGSEVYIPGDDDYHQPTDPAIPTQDLTGNAVDFGLGLNYTWRQWHAGLSATHLASPRINLRQEGSSQNELKEFQTQLKRTFYFDAGGNIALKNTLFILQPSVLLATDTDDFAGVAGLHTTYNGFLTFGASYRINDGVGINIGAEYKKFFLGYAFDWPTSALGGASAGSHEIVLGYRLKLDFTGQNKHRHRSIRIM